MLFVFGDENGKYISFKENKDQNSASEKRGNKSIFPMIYCLYLYMFFHSERIIWGWGKWFSWRKGITPSFDFDFNFCVVDPLKKRSQDVSETFFAETVTKKFDLTFIEFLFWKVKHLQKPSIYHGPLLFFRGEITFWSFCFYINGGKVMKKLPLLFIFEYCVLWAFRNRKT